MSDTENMESSVQLEPHCLALADGGIEMTCRVSNGADRELYLRGERHLYCIAED